MLLRGEKLFLMDKWSCLADFGHEWQDSPSLLRPLLASEQTTAIAFYVYPLCPIISILIVLVFRWQQAVVQRHEINTQHLEYINSSNFRSSSNRVSITIITTISSLLNHSLNNQLTLSNFTNQPKQPSKCSSPLVPSSPSPPRWPLPTWSSTSLTSRLLASPTAPSARKQYPVPPNNISRSLPTNISPTATPSELSRSAPARPPPSSARPC